MTKFARGWMAASGVAVWLGTGPLLLAQSGGASNPLRTNPPPASNQPVYNSQPRLAQQPNQRAPMQSPPLNQANPNGQPTGAGQPIYGGGQSSQGYQQPQQSLNGPGQPSRVLPNGQPAQPRQLPIQPPFVLTQQEQAELDKLLAEWEAQSNNIKTFSCKFSRYTYNPAFVGNNNNQPTALDEGEIKYATPDRGMFKVNKTVVYVLDQKSKKYEPKPGDDGEWWTCSGTSIYNVNNADKTIEEYPLPKELQGKAITEGPLPFVFGAKATALKERYFIRDITPPPEVGKNVWLEVFPKYRRDAQNFQSVEVILEKSTMLPAAMKLIDPGATPNNLSRTVYILDGHSVNAAWQKIEGWFGDFSIPKKSGYKHIVKKPPESAPQQAQPPAQVRNPGAAQPAAPRQAFVPQTPQRR